MARYGQDTKKQANDLIEALDRVNALETIQTEDFLEMVRLAKVLHKIAEHECNGYSYKAMEGRKFNSQVTIGTIAVKYGLKVDFDGDPRGYVVKIHAPKGDVYNTWGGRESGYGIG